MTLMSDDDVESSDSQTSRLHSASHSSTFGEFPPPVGKEYILRTLISRPAPWSRPSPQRMYCVLTSGEFRLAGAFTTDTCFVWSLMKRSRACIVGHFNVAHNAVSFMQYSSVCCCVRVSWLCGRTAAYRWDHSTDLKQLTATVVKASHSLPTMLCKPAKHIQH